MRVALRWTIGLALLALLGFGAYEASESPANQLFGKTIVSGPSNERVVALTYDDGPNPPYTQRILDVLDREGVHATFFLVGRAVAAYPQIVAREARSGDALGNHTWDHGHLIIMNPAQVRQSLTRTDDAIFAASGVRTHLMRPPFGSRDWLVLDQARKMGYTPVMWSVPLARDWEYPPAPVIAARILRYVHDGSIIVLHDGNRGLLCSRTHLNPHLCDRSNDIEATRLIVDALKKRGYRFVTIPQLIAIKGPMRTPAPGTE
ncbi:MAG TPA: polysaccharide deacetylase family protein [Candidatus Baltobacteraceae bacterium]|nr:polysaccharide deacetylase family protein [Candidatus Baltobacteraceae bacterium]